MTKKNKTVQLLAITIFAMQLGAGCAKKDSQVTPLTPQNKQPPKIEPQANSNEIEKAKAEALKKEAEEKADGEKAATEEKEKAAAEKKAAGKKADAETTKKANEAKAEVVRKETEEAARKAAQQTQVKVENKAEKKPEQKPKEQTGAKTEEKKVVQNLEAKPVEVKVAESKPVETNDVDEGSASIFKMTIKNARPFESLAKSKDSVMYQSKVTSLFSIQKTLLTGNEDHYCQVTLKGELRDNEVLGLTDSNREQTDAQHDVYKTQITFKNKMVELNFICIHTTPSFFMEDFAINFSPFMSLVDMDGKSMLVKDYINEKTEKRMYQAIKVLNVEKLNMIVMSDDTEVEGMALVDGQIIGVKKAVASVVDGKTTMACVISEKAGEISNSKIYLGIEKGVAKETPQDDPNGTTFIDYRADADNYFRMLCFLKKTTNWNQLLKTTKNVFQTGALNRLEYNKKYDEIKAIHEEIKKNSKQK